MERYRNPETLSPQQEYLRTLTTVNNLCQEAQLRPMFVGGVIAKAIHLGNIGQMKMDFANRTAYVPTQCTTIIQQNA